MIVGLAGPGGCGKDSVGKILKEKHGFYLTSFAYPIKKMICSLLDVPLDKWHDRAWREQILPLYGVSPRYMAQTIGTEWGRNIIKDALWLDVCLGNIVTELPGYADIAIMDVRFDNEAERIRSWPGSGEMIHISRGISDMTEHTRSHVSESGVAKLSSDLYIENNSTLQALEDRVASIVERLL